MHTHVILMTATMHTCNLMAAKTDTWVTKTDQELGHTLCDLTT